MTDNPTDEEYQDEHADYLAALGVAASIAIMGVIARRLRKVDENTTYAQARAWLTQDMPKIDRYVAFSQDKITAHADKLLDAAGDYSDAWAEPYYEARGLTQPATKGDPFLSHALDSGKRQTASNVSDLMRTSVLRLQSSGGQMVPIADAYSDAMDTAIRAISSGKQDYNDAISDAVSRFTGRGLKVQYESGAVRDLYSAVSMNVMDGYRATTQAIREQQGVQFGADGVEVSAHGLCAADHLPYQGRQFSKAAFATVQGGLRRQIGKGWNCRHTVHPVILGVSSPAYTDKEREAIKKESTRKTGVMVGGKDTTAYEFSQWQRSRETLIRKNRATAKTMRDAGQDTTAIDAHIKGLEREYSQLSKQAGVETRWERTRIYDID